MSHHTQHAVRRAHLASHMHRMNCRPALGSAWRSVTISWCDCLTLQWRLSTLSAIWSWGVWLC